MSVAPDLGSATSAQKRWDVDDAAGGSGGPGSRPTRVTAPSGRVLADPGIAMTGIPTTRAQEILSTLVDCVRPGRDLPVLLVAACAANVPVSGAGLALMTDTGPGAILAVTDGPARVMEELQASLGEGPCVDASDSGHMVLQPDLAVTAPERWPEFAAGALSVSIGAVFAFPLHVGAIRLGVLDLYRDSVGGLDDDELAEALAFADAATAVLLSLQATAGPSAMHPLLSTSVADRAEVHQATGMIAEQADVSLLDALALLRGRAFATDRGIADLAGDVLKRLLNFTDDGDDGRGPH